MIAKTARPVIYICLVVSTLLAATWAMAHEGSRRFGQTAVIPGAERQTLSIHGMKRNYLVYKPAGVKLPAPVVFAFHGGGGTAEGTDRVSGGFAALADREGFVVVYPNAIDKHWFDGRPTVANTNYDDVKFIATIIENLVADGTIDARRIYACGISNGGFFSQYLAIKLPGKFAAVASVAASVPKDFFDMRIKPTPIMMLLGTEDPLIPFNGGKIGGTILPGDRGEVVPAREAVQFWLSRNGVQDAPVVSKLPSKDASGTKVTVERYGTPTSANEVIYYEIDGGGHTWPGGMQYLAKRFIGPVCRDFSGNQVIWEFFREHSLSPG